MNCCIFVGNLVSDPELKTYENAKGEFTVCNFAIGVNNRRFDRAAFPQCEAFGKTAEIIAESFSKGDLIRVYTELIENTVENDDGTKRKYSKYRVNNWEFPEINNYKKRDAEDEEEVDEEEKPKAKAKTKPKKDEPKAKAKPAPKRAKPKVEEEEEEEEEEDDDNVPF